MTDKERLLYFKWLLKIVCNEYQMKYYSILLKTLFDREFIWSIERDKNRSDDGLALRKRYTDSKKMAEDTSPCSVLEMMIALADRCEDQIMGVVGEEPMTYKWFWIMIRNMGLSEMDNGRFDRMLVEQNIDIMLYREYSRDGHGGLFIIENPRKDLRKTEIWYQMCWYLDEIVIF